MSATRMAASLRVTIMALLRVSPTNISAPPGQSIFARRLAASWFDAGCLTGRGGAAMLSFHVTHSGFQRARGPPRHSRSPRQDAARHRRLDRHRRGDCAGICRAGGEGRGRLPFERGGSAGARQGNRARGRRGARRQGRRREPGGVRLHSLRDHGAVRPPRRPDQQRRPDAGSVPVVRGGGCARAGGDRSQRAFGRIDDARGGSLAQRQGGFIINTTSIAARNGGAGGAVFYAAAKGFVSTLTRGQAKELIGKGIRVNAVAPGVIATPFHERYTDAAAFEAIRTTIPIGRVGTPEECIGAYLFLASETLSGYVVGQVIEVNGGQLMP